MSDSEDEADKTHEPSQKKLDDARKKGQIVRSADVTSAMVYGGFLLTFTVWGGRSVTDLGSSLQSLFINAGLLPKTSEPNTFSPFLFASLAETGRTTVAWFVIPAIAALLAIFAQQALTFTPSNLQFKLSRISIASNAKNKFGGNGLFEFVKSTIKLIAYSLVLGIFLFNRLELLMTMPNSEPGPALLLLVDILLQLMGMVLIVAVIIAAVDYLWQYFAHMQRQRMSLKELKDELKESDGDPAMKQNRRARAQEIATRQMAAEVQKSDVIIVNPTHYAVALKWSKNRGSAPKCVAKGVDEVALQIRSLAQAAGVPIHHDPTTARALYATVNLDQEISVEHYQAVAVAIRFAENMRQKARKWI